MNNQEIIDKYPEIFKDCRCGFCCPDGWLHIVEGLCSFIENYRKNAVFNYKIDEEQVPFVRCRQIKEKFGTLCFYFDLENTKSLTKEQLDKFWHSISVAIWAVESLSGYICQNTGKPGKLRTDLRWVLTLCDEEYEERKKRIKGQ